VKSLAVGPLPCKFVLACVESENKCADASAVLEYHPLSLLSVISSPCLSFLLICHQDKLLRGFGVCFFEIFQQDWCHCAITWNLPHLLEIIAVMASALFGHNMDFLCKLDQL